MVYTMKCLSQESSFSCIAFVFSSALNPPGSWCGCASVNRPHANIVINPVRDFFLIYGKGRDTIRRVNQTGQVKQRCKSEQLQRRRAWELRDMDYNWSKSVSVSLS